MTDITNSATEANTSEATGDAVVANSIMRDGSVIIAHSLSAWDRRRCGDVLL